MLSLERQNAYRARYQALRPGWQASGQVYESIVRRHALPGCRWLDVGCGRGGIVELLGGQVRLCAGTDLDLASLIEHRAPHTRRIAAPVEALPLAAGSDLVTCSWVIEHLADPHRAFAGLRVRRQATIGPFTPNSRNLGRLPTGWFTGGCAGSCAGCTPATRPILRGRYRANTPERIERLAREVGLRRAQVRLIGDPTYLAFNNALFALASLLELVTPPGLRVHIVGDYQKGE
jgi:hypothetical protein